jgi:hypothetical protein
LSPWVVLHNIRLKANLLAGGIFLKEDVKVTHLVSIKGTVGSVPKLRDSPLHNRNVFNRPFFTKKRSPLNT